MPRPSKGNRWNWWSVTINSMIIRKYALVLCTDSDYHSPDTCKLCINYLVSSPWASVTAAGCFSIHTAHVDNYNYDRSSHALNHYHWWGWNYDSGFFTIGGPWSGTSVCGIYLEDHMHPWEYESSLHNKRYWYFLERVFVVLIKHIDHSKAQQTYYNNT